MLAVVLAGLLLSTATLLSAVAINVATGGDAPWFPTMDDHPLRWAAASVPLVALGGWLIWWAQRGYESQRTALIPASQRPEPWMVDRPRELAAIIRALRRGSTTVGITTAVHGAGGFGKTTIARLVRADARIARHFGRRVYWVTLGRDARRGALVEKVNDLVKQIDPARAQPFTDIGQAADHLAAVLAEGPRRLVILDDVWFDDQLAAFPVTGRCARLVTTRVATLVGPDAVPVAVDQMSPEQARLVLTADLPRPPPEDVIDRLLTETGNWPLLLRLVNKVMVDQLRSRADVAAVSRELLARLHHDGPLTVDRLNRVDTAQLDINDPQQRDKAVSATIEAGAGLLRPEERALFGQLAIFVEDEVVPVSLVAALWQKTGNVGEAEARQLCARLADLALLSLSGTDSGGTISLHDVVRDYLAQGFTPAELRRLHTLLLDSVRVTPWWDLPENSRYLRDHLIEHLLASGRHGEAEEVATNLCWVTTRLEDNGPAAPAADLAHVDTSRARLLNRLLQQSAHLLGPAEPARSRAEIFYDRVAHSDGWAVQARLLAQQSSLTSVWPLPDLPDPALRRALRGPTSGINALVITPDGRRLISGGDDGAVRLWDPDSGQEARKLGIHRREVTVLAVSPDGTWLASGDHHGSLRLWDVTTGRPLRSIVAHQDEVSALAISADGAWLATGSADGSARLWDPRSGRQISQLRQSRRPDRDREQRRRPRPRPCVPDFAAWVTGIDIAPDGRSVTITDFEGVRTTWNATNEALGTRLLGRHTIGIVTPNSSHLVGGRSRIIKSWAAEIAGRTREFALSDRDATVQIVAVAAASDGSLIAAGTENGSTHLWNARTGQEITSIVSHSGQISALAVSPGGEWIATAGNDGALRMWSVSQHGDRVSRTWLSAPIRAVAVAPDGTWLALQSDDKAGEVRIWRSGESRPDEDAISSGFEVHGLAVSPAGRLAMASTRHVGIWWPAGRSQHGLSEKADAQVVAHSDDWLAAGCRDGGIILVHFSAYSPAITLTGHTGAVTALAFLPGRSWFASGGSDATVRIWACDSAEKLATLHGHSATVNALAAAPDGTWLASGGDDRTIRLWDPAGQRQIARLGADAGAVSSLAVSPDGRLLSSTSSDGTARIWDVEDRRVIAMTRVNGSLTTSAWHTDSRHLYLGGNGGLYCFRLQPTKTQKVWPSGSA
ncbi:hypothetical protein ACTI_00920 [Actinoplanes sp. OR16]|uniref:NB-ARC domain-containing protein n=1 Tax=Actinoplanes sp. OR16 TaxID=946334 RepID=UPI000F7064D1|nr:NB-ARC domain-containing protein [Actinoplanes sp. OR16]BBH63407.1 hypothetical protein ACTI_00920 [Actinoplanes sp. OR16]